MEPIRPFVQFCHVRLKDRDYSVVVYMNVTNRRVHAFKYSEKLMLCDYSWFDDIHECTDWLDKQLS